MPSVFDLFPELTAMAQQAAEPLPTEPNQTPEYSLGQAGRARLAQQQELELARSRLGNSWFPNLESALQQSGHALQSMGERAMAPVELLTNPRNFFQNSASDRAADASNRAADAWAQASSERDQQLAESGQNWMPSIVKRGFRGAVSTLPTAAAAAAVGGPVGAIGAAMAQEGNQAITEGQDSGMTGGQQSTYAATQALIEGGIAAVFQKVGWGGLETTLSTKQIAKQTLKEAAKQAGYRTLQEVPEEVITEWGHLFARKMAGTTPKAANPKELLSEIWNTGADTFVQTAITMGLAEGQNVYHAAQTGRERGARLEEIRLGERKAKSEARTKAAEALADPDFATVWAERNPDRAGILQGIASPSRSEWRDVTGFRIDGNPTQREAFANNVRMAIARKQPAGREGEPINDQGYRLNRDIRATAEARAAEQPTAPEPVPLEGATVPQFPTTQLSNEWTQIDASQPLPQSGVEVYRDRHGQTFVRAAGSQGGNGQESVGNRLGIGSDRKAALEAMSIGQLNQEASRYGIKKGPKKAKMIEKIMAAEGGDRGSQIQPSTSVDMPVSPQNPVVDQPQHPATVAVTAPAQPVATPTAPTPAPAQINAEAPISPQIASVEQPAQPLPPDLARLADDELGNWIKEFGGEKVPRNPPKTFRARLDKAANRILDAIPPLRDALSGQPQQQLTPAAQENPATPAPREERTSVRRVGADEKAAAHSGLAKAFPGSSITELPATREHMGGYRVELPNGRFFDVLFLPQSALTDRTSIIKSLRGQLGRDPTAQEISDASAMGAFFVETKDGRKMPGLGAVALAVGNFDNTTIKHEGIHLARRIGLFTEAEWQALENKYAKGVRDRLTREGKTPQEIEDGVEEAIAYSTKAWDNSEPTFTEKIKAFFSTMLRAMGINPDARLVEVLMRSPEFWARNPTTQQDMTPKRAVKIDEIAADEVMHEIAGQMGMEFDWHKKQEGIVLNLAMDNTRSIEDRIARARLSTFLGRYTPDKTRQFLETVRERLSSQPDVQFTADVRSNTPTAQTPPAAINPTPVNEVQTDKLVLRNEKPRKTAPKEVQPTEKQDKMFSGMNLLPGQQDLFKGMDQRGKVEGEDYPPGWTWPEYKKQLEQIRDLMNREADSWNTALHDVLGGADPHARAMQMRKVRNNRDRGNDAEAMKNFDVTLDRARKDYPQLLAGRYDDETNFIDNLSKGFRDRVTINSPEVQKEAWDSAKSDTKAPDQGDSYEIPDDPVFGGGGAMSPNSDVPFQVKRANIGETGPVRRFTQEQDPTYNPETRPDEVPNAEASRRLKENGYEAERARLMRVAETGGDMNDTDVIVARRVFNAEAQEALKSGDSNAILGAQKVLEAYRRTGTEQGRAFRQRRDWQETPVDERRRTLAEAVLTPPTKTKEAIDNAMKEGNGAEAERLRRKWADEYKVLKKQLMLLGVDLDNLNAYGYDPVKAARALGTVRAAKADAWDKAYEYWRNAILSGTGTQVTNALGTAIHGGWKFLVERPLESVVNLAMRRPEGAQIGEFRHVASGILPGLQRAARNAMIAWNTELPELERQLSKEAEWRIEEPNVAIKGTHGRVIRAPQRLMLAADDFMKSFFATMDVGAQAYRAAKAQGLTGDKMREFIAREVNDLHSTSWAKAHDTSLEVAFQQKGTKASRAAKRALLDLRRDVEVLGVKPLAFIFPFVTTPVNILETGLRKAPVTGDFAAMKKMYDNWRAGRSIMTDMSPRLAERIVAWGTVLALSALVGGDGDEPFITGTIDSKDRGQRDLSRRTFHPQSINIGGRWYSYSRVEPFATALALTVDWVNAGAKAKQTKDYTGLATTPFTSLFSQMKDKTFLDGVGDVMRIIESPDPVEEMANWSSNFAVSWVPNIVRSTLRATSDTYPERGVWGEGGEKAMRLGKRMLQRTELGIVKDQPAIDLWGREAKRGTSPIPHTDFLWRIMSPSESRIPELFIGDRAILNWNAKHPGEEFLPSMPQRSIKVDGKAVSLTDEQLTDYLKLSGTIAKGMVDRLNIDPENPTEDTIKEIKDAIETARSRARDTLKSEWKGGPRMAPEAIVTAEFNRDVNARADVLTRLPPKRLLERRKWLAERAEALNWLKSKGVSKDAVINAYVPELKSIKTPKTRFQKRARLLRSLSSL